jgi:hypothetical protein
MDGSEEVKVLKKSAALSAGSWRHFRLDYSVIGSSWIITTIVVATLRMNSQACPSFVIALSQSPGEVLMILATFWMVIFPVIGISIAIGGSLGFAVKLHTAKMFVLVTIFAVASGVAFADSSTHWLCGGGPWL